MVDREKQNASIRVLLDLSAGEFCAIVDGKADKRIWDAPAYLSAFDAASGMDGNL